jgi:hypothetical protein
MPGMLITLRVAELSDVRAMAAIRAQQWETEPFWANRIGSYLRGITPHNRLYRTVPLSSPWMETNWSASLRDIEHAASDAMASCNGSMSSRRDVALALPTN